MASLSWIATQPPDIYDGHGRAGWHRCGAGEMGFHSSDGSAQLMICSASNAGSMI